MPRRHENWMKTRAIDMDLEGCSAYEISETLNVSKRTVYQWLKDFKERIPPFVGEHRYYDTDPDPLVFRARILAAIDNITRELGMCTPSRAAQLTLALSRLFDLLEQANHTLNITGDEPRPDHEEYDHHVNPLPDLAPEILARQEQVSQEGAQRFERETPAKSDTQSPVDVTLIRWE